MGDFQRTFKCLNNKMMGGAKQKPSRDKKKKQDKKTSALSFKFYKND